MITEREEFVQDYYPETGMDEDGGLFPYGEGAPEIANYIEGCDYPLDKGSLCDCVKSSGAPKDVLSYVGRLPDRDYYAPSDVQDEYRKIS